MFRQLLTFDEAKKTIERELPIKPLGIEEISLLKSWNRVLAENIIADMNIPPFNRSIVDGYAARAEDTFGADENSPVVLHVCGKVNIGELPKTIVKKEDVVEIATGAPMPKGADAVVMLEHTHRKGTSLTVTCAVAKGENLMKAGSDIKKGETLLKKGQLLGSREIGLLAALGKGQAKVYITPRISVLSTGPELIEPGSKLPPGKIYDINAYTLSAAVLESGGKPVYMGVYPDKAEELRRALMQALASSDMVVTSGAVSVGPKDIMPKTLGSLGEPGIILSGVAIKPGKPFTVASAVGKAVFSLPGHPTSALLTFILFVRPLIQVMSGREAVKPPEVKAYASVRMFSAKGRRTFIMVKLKKNNSEELIADLMPSGLSGAITTLERADGFVEIPENVQFIDAGDQVTVKLLTIEFCAAKLV